MALAITVLLSILAGLAHGIREGMVMIKPGDALFAGAEQGIRGHYGACEYHAITLCVYVIIMAWAVMIYRQRDRWRTDMVRVIGMLVFMWSTAEIGYNISRYGTAIGYVNGQAYAHINFGDIVSWHIHGMVVYIIWTARLIAGISLTIIGGHMRRIHFIIGFCILLLVPVIANAGVMELVANLPGIGALATGAAGLVAAYVFKQIPNDILAGTVGNLFYGFGVAVTLGLTKWKVTAGIWNSVVEPWVIDFIDNTIGSAVAGLIRGMRSDNGS